MKVHILLGGKPLCGFSKDVPDAWPAGHLWVTRSDTEARNIASDRGVLCLLCDDVLVKQGAGAHVHVADRKVAGR